MQEETVKAKAVLEASAIGLLPMRNNVGVAVDETGRHIRYGLMNESKKVNKEFKSSDLICITPILIQPQHVGRIFGIFTAIETKESDWKFRQSDEHTKAQLRFHNLVKCYGGFAGFVNGEGQIRRLIDL